MSVKNDEESCPKILFLSFNNDQRGIPLLKAGGNNEPQKTVVTICSAEKQDVLSLSGAPSLLILLFVMHNRNNFLRPKSTHPPQQVTLHC